MKWAYKIIAAVFGGFLFAFVGVMLLASAGVVSKAGFPVLMAIGAVIALTAPSGAKSWRRLLILSGLLCLLLPLGGIIHAGGALAESQTGAEAAGTAIGGGLAVGLMGFVGFFAGAVLLVAGFLTGRDKQVIIVDRQAA